jgi:hypothetical protein
MSWVVISLAAGLLALEASARRRLTMRKTGPVHVGPLLAYTLEVCRRSSASS